MHEVILNLHMHTTYSDGSGTHGDIAQAAMRAGLDAVFVTDHNVLVNGMEGYYETDGKRILMLIGEEVHDQARDPQKNHMLVFGAGREMSVYASDPQGLIDKINRAEGLAFLAHPVDLAMPAFGEDDISWVDWQVQGFTGIELWNGFSEFKAVARNRLQAYALAFNPRSLAQGPLPETLRRWDELLAAGKRVVAIGGSDAHALKKHAGPLHRTIFPYEFHFRAINTHLLLPAPLSGEVAEDKRLILEALKAGHAFVGYDLPAPTRGFRFTAQGKELTANMGDRIPVRGGITFQIHLPHPTPCHLLKDGKVIKTWKNREICTLIGAEPGVYRVEAYIHYRGKRRGWIFSNPIYVQGD